METKIQSKPSDEKRDWFSDHELTKDKLAQLIQKKIDRIRVYQEATEKVNKLTGIN